MATKTRLSTETFNIDVHGIRAGHYSAKYFVREKELLEALHYSRTVLMQVFQKRNAVLCGTDEAIAVLKLCGGYYTKPEKAAVISRQILLRLAVNPAPKRGAGRDQI